MTSESPSREHYGEVLADIADLLDRQLSPLGLIAIDALAPRWGERIADIGCGCGQTVVQIADRVGPDGRVIGIDIEPRPLAVAAARSAGLGQISLRHGDAGTIDLPDGELDGLFSRFGVMAFGDPVATFRHLRRGLKPDGRLAFVCWRALEDNQLDHLPLQASRMGDPVDPTPFSFADPGVVRATLAASGFSDIEISGHDALVSSGDMDAMVTVLTRVGALGKILRASPELRPAVEIPLRSALAGHRVGSTVSLNAAVWLVTARNCSDYAPAVGS